MKTKLMSIVAGVCGGAYGLASAQHAGDVLLTVENGRIVTGLIDETGTNVRSNVRVFGAKLGEIVPNFTDEPGFDNEPGTFAVGSRIGFNVRRAVRVYDDHQFGTVSGSFEIAFGPLSVQTHADDVPVPGFSLPVGINGEWHTHLEYTLLSPAEDGLYLLELELYSDEPGVGTSLPFWFVFNQNQSEQEHAVALRWANVHLAGACVADVDDGTQSGNYDGGVTIDDLLYYLALFEAGDALADVDDGTATGAFDGGVTIDDLLYFVQRFEAGC
jgi:hypothetical protein